MNKTITRFDFNTVDDFDKHIELSIPNYNFLIENVKYMTECLVDGGTNMLDIGCSTGKMLFDIKKETSCSYIGYDISNLLPKYNDSNLSFRDTNVITDDIINNCSVITSIFTLQFLPRNKRQCVIDKIYNSLNKGGAFIMCEKTYSNNSLIGDITNSIYYKYKLKSFTADEILEKQQKLAVTMKLNTTDEIFKELSMFSHVEVFWKSYGFVGFIAIK